MRLHQLTIPLLVSWLLALVLAGTIGSFGIPFWALLGVLGSFPLILVRQIGQSGQFFFHQAPASVMAWRDISARPASARIIRDWRPANVRFTAGGCGA